MIAGKRWHRDQSGVPQEEDEMSEQVFDTFTRKAAQAVSRRSSLAALSGAALAAGLLATPLTTAAKDNKAKKAKKKAKKRCAQQEAQCLESLRPYCTLPVNEASQESVSAEGTPEFCQQFFSPCCQFFSTCNAQAGVTCLLQKSEEWLLPAKA